MSDWVLAFLSVEGLTPHGYCLTWRPDIFWTMVASDAVIAMSYFSIPAVIIYFATQRRDLKFRWVLVLFGLFIVACGTTHVMGIVTLWIPAYGIEAASKALTAAVSLLTAILLWPLVPKALAIPSRSELEEAIASLRYETQERKVAQDALETLNKNQEQLIAERTAELKEANRQLVQEVLERRVAEQSSRDRAHFIERLLEAIPTPVFHKDSNGRYTGCNKSFEDFFQVTKNDIVGHTVYEVWPQASGEVFFRNDSALFEAPGIQVYETSFHGADGRHHTVEFHKASLSKADGSCSGLVGVMWDVTERNQAAEQIRFLAHHDPLTELPNRLLVRDRFDQLIAHNGREQCNIAVAYLDIDNFKTVNDSLSHATGDALLQEIARRLKASVRGMDTVSRLGGDEFLIVLPDITGPEFVAVITARILEELAVPFHIEGHQFSITASIGIALHPEDGHDLDTLLRKADIAMYRAKESGRNAFQFFDKRLEADAHEHFTLREQLRSALTRQEFVVHYQPEVDIASGRIVGAEALIRWNHTDRGLVSPIQFIPTAEATGLIVPIGAWVLREACREAMTWQGDARSEMFVSVNLSAIQFKRTDLEKTVADVLADTGLPPHLLELELTETILMSDITLGLDIIRRFKAMGIRIAIDDFGTGYSSLSYLKRLEVNKLKIDKSFVMDMCANQNDAAIVCAIVLMARSIGISVIAEGVESEQAMELLKLCRCDQAQGFHIARPMPSADFQQLLRTGERTASAL